jgi:hypothetical protein
VNLDIAIEICVVEGAIFGVVVLIVEVMVLQAICVQI